MTHPTCRIVWQGLAFALDPDGYWIELVRRKAGLFLGEQNYFNLSQTMLRVKDPQPHRTVMHS
jgi:lactoylglutathione lyase